LSSIVADSCTITKQLLKVLKSPWITKGFPKPLPLVKISPDIKKNDSIP
jgi:hypothetical protein